MTEISKSSEADTRHMDDMAMRDFDQQKALQAWERIKDDCDCFIKGEEEVFYCIKSSSLSINILKPGGNVGSSLELSKDKDGFFSIIKHSGLVVGEVNSILDQIAHNPEIDINKWPVAYPDYSHITSIISTFNSENSKTISKDLQQRLISTHNRVLEQLRDDPLTGVHNFQHMTESLKVHVSKAAGDGESLGLLVIDIDNFKRFNEMYGHNAGDELLKRVAQILKENVDNDAIVSRQGGDEFSVILPKTNMQDTQRVAEKLRITIGQQSAMEFNGRQLPNITISLGGLSVVKPDDITDSFFLSVANNALNESKVCGKAQTTMFDYDRFVKMLSESSIEAVQKESSDISSVISRYKI